MELHGSSEMCVCVCVCVRERVRVRERAREREMVIKRNTGRHTRGGDARGDARSSCGAPWVQGLGFRVQDLGFRN